MERRNDASDSSSVSETFWRRDPGLGHRRGRLGGLRRRRGIDSVITSGVVPPDPSPTIPCGGESSPRRRLGSSSSAALPLGLAAAALALSLTLCYLYRRRQDALYDPASSPAEAERRKMVRSLNDDEGSGSRTSRGNGSRDGSEGKVMGRWAKPSAFGGYGDNVIEDADRLKSRDGLRSCRSSRWGEVIVEEDEGRDGDEDGGDEFVEDEERAIARRGVGTAADEEKVEVSEREQAGGPDPANMTEEEKFRMSQASQWDFGDDHRAPPPGGGVGGDDEDAGGTAAALAAGAGAGGIGMAAAAVAAIERRESQRQKRSAMMAGGAAASPSGRRSRNDDSRGDDGFDDDLSHPGSVTRAGRRRHQERTDAFLHDDVVGDGDGPIQRSKFDEAFPEAEQKKIKFAEGSKDPSGSSGGRATGTSGSSLNSSGRSLRSLGGALKRTFSWGSWSSTLQTRDNSKSNSSGSSSRQKKLAKVDKFATSSDVGSLADRSWKSRSTIERSRSAPPATDAAAGPPSTSRRWDRVKSFFGFPDPQRVQERRKDPEAEEYVPRLAGEAEENYSWSYLVTDSRSLASGKSGRRRGVEKMNSIEEGLNEAGSGHSSRHSGKNKDGVGGDKRGPSGLQISITRVPRGAKGASTAAAAAATPAPRFHDDEDRPDNCDDDDDGRSDLESEREWHERMEALPYKFDPRDESVCSESSAGGGGDRDGTTPEEEGTEAAAVAIAAGLPPVPEESSRAPPGRDGAGTPEGGGAPRRLLDERKALRPYVIGAGGATPEEEEEEEEQPSEGLGGVVSAADPRFEEEEEETGSGKDGASSRVSASTSSKSRVATFNEEGDDVGSVSERTKATTPPFASKERQRRNSRMSRPGATTATTNDATRRRGSGGSGRSGGASSKSSMSSARRGGDNINVSDRTMVENVSAADRKAQRDSEEALLHGRAKSVLLETEVVGPSPDDGGNGGEEGLGTILDDPNDDEWEAMAVGRMMDARKKSMAVANRMDSLTSL